MITNKVTKLKYIGKSSNLQGRFIYFFSAGHLDINKGGSLIYRNLLRFGFKNFSLTILEYCSIHNLQSRKQHFINIFKPRLNFRKDVWISSFGGIAPKFSSLATTLPAVEASISNLKMGWASPEAAKDEIIHDLHRLNTDLKEFKKNIAIPIEVKDMMDLAESNNNPLG
jgi:group I intron endonuclease